MRPQRVWLNDLALETLERAKRDTEECDYVFANLSLTGRIADYAKARKAINAEAGTDVTAHDLRRTAATCMTGKLDISRPILSKILSHADSGVTAIYDRASYDQDKREAWEKWVHFLADKVA